MRTLHKLEGLLRESPARLEVLGVPNARVRADQLAWQALAEADGTVAELRESLTTGATGAVQPEALWELGERLGYVVRVTWSRTQGADCVDVLFEHAEVADRRMTACDSSCSVQDSRQSCRGLPGPTVNAGTVLAGDAAIRSPVNGSVRSRDRPPHQARTVLVATALREILH